MAKFTVVKNNEVLGVYDGLTTSFKAIELYMNRHADLEPEKIVDKGCYYRPIDTTEEVNAYVQIWRYNRTLYFEQFLIIEGRL